MKSDREVFLLKETKVDNGDIGNITSNRTDVEEITVNGFQGYFVKDFDMATLVLSDGEYMIELFGPLSKEELISVAESLE